MSRENASRITADFDLDKKIGSKNKKERRLDVDSLRTWKRIGNIGCFYIELRKLGTNIFELNVRGSLHVFYHRNNNGKFKGREIIVAIDNMCLMFHVEANEMKIRYLEVGVNIPFLNCVLHYLSNNLLYHKKVTKRPNRKKNHNGFEFDHEDSMTKVYEKDKHLLRFEVRCKRDMLQSFNIYNVSDLNENSINGLTEILTPDFITLDMRGGIDLLDTKLNPNNLTMLERQLLLKFSSVFYQQSYADNLREAKVAGLKNRSAALQKQANRLRKNCRNIISIKGDGIQQELATEIMKSVVEFKSSWN